MEAINKLRLKTNIEVIRKIKSAVVTAFKNKKSRRIIIIVTLAVLIPVTIYSILEATRVKADWYDDSYNQRQKVSYTHNADVSAERRVSITVDTDTLIIDGKMQIDCDDVLFTSIDGKLLKYTLVSGCDTSTTVFDVVVDSVTNGGNNLYMYYSNPIAHSTIDGSVSSVTSLSPNGGAPTTGSEEIGPSPSMYLKFDEGYGGTAYDSTSNGNNATLGDSSVPDQKLRQEINIIDHIATASGDDPSLIQLDTTKYSGTVTYYFEVVAKVSSGTLTVALERNGTSTQDSTISVTETSFTRKRSVSFTPPAGTTEYNINLANGTSPEVKAARIIVFQNIGKAALTSTQTQIELGNYEVAKSNTTDAALNSPKYWNYTEGNWDGTKTFSAEVVYKVSGTSGTQSWTTATSGTWTGPSGVQSVKVEAWGGGGGGGGQNTTQDGGGGGGGGAHSTTNAQAVTPGSSYSYSVGAGGAGGTSGAGQSGGNTYFINATTVMAQGGKPGVNSTGTPPAGGLGGDAASGYGDTKHSGGQGEIGRNSPTGVGGYGGSSAGTASAGYSGPQTWSTEVYPTASTPAGAGHGGDGGTAGVNGFAPVSGNGGGGGGSGDGSGKTGGAGADGKLTLTWTITATIKLQEDNGSFSGWTDKATIVSSGTATSSTRVRVSFTPATGKNYRLVTSEATTNGTYDIYSAKVVVDQTGTSGVTKLESQYLIGNTLLSPGTALQNFDTLFDPAEIYSQIAYYYHEISSVQGFSEAKLQRDPNGTPVDIPNTEITQTDNLKRSAAFSAPTSSQTVDVIAYTNYDDIYSSSILSLKTFSATNPTLPTWISSNDYCLSGGCLALDGSDDVGVVSDNEPINFGKKLNTGFTIQMWVRANTLGESSTGKIFSKGIDNYLGLAAGSTNQLADLTAKIDLGITDATLTIDDAVTLNQWHLISLTYTNDSDDEISIYVDGILKGTSINGDGSPATETNNLFLGAGSSGSHFDGYIDEFKIYAKERTLAEIQTDNIRYSPTLHGTSAAFGNDSTNFVSDGLVGHWKMDETTTPSVDSSGNDNAGTWQASPVASNGKFTGALSLNGSTQYVTVSSSASLTLTGDVTLSAWVNRDTAGQADTIINYASTGETETANNLYLFSIDASNNLILQWENGAGTNNSVNSSEVVLPTSGAWVFYSVTRDSTKKEVKFFQNGVQLGTTQSYVNNPSGGTTATLAIGRDNENASDYFDGTIDELRVYNRVLTPEEIYTLTELSPSSNLYYKFEENIGTTTYDVSGNGATGTLSEGASFAPGRYGSGVSFDGNNDYVTTTSSSYISPTSSIAVSAWVSVDNGFSTSAPSNMGIMDKGDYQLFLDQTDGKAKWGVDDNVSKTFSNIGQGTGVSSSATTLAVYNGNLYVGGAFLTAGGVTVNYIAKYNDSTNTFSNIGQGTGVGGTVYALTVYNGNLYLGGAFTTAGGVAVNNIAKYNDQTNQFSNIGQGTGVDDSVTALAVYNGNLYVGGYFVTAGGVTVNRIAKYNDSTNTFSNIGQTTGVSNYVNTLAVHNGNLYVGGAFLTAGGVTVSAIAKYNDQTNQFSNIGQGTGVDSTVSNLTVYNGNLYVGGAFLTAGGVTVNYIAKYNDSTNTFSNIGQGTGVGGTVYALTVYNGNLYLGGAFTTAGGVAVNNIAKYNDQTNQFSNIGQGTGVDSTVNTLAVHNGNLYVGGTFTTAGGVNVNRITKYGTSNLKTVASTTSSWTSNTWYHVAGTFDGTNLRIYVNGVLENTTINGSAYALNSAAAPLLVGKSYGSQQGEGGSGEILKGRIDDLKIYSYPAEAKQVSKDLAADYPAPDPTLGAPIGYWRFDEGGGTTIYDRTGNSKNLTTVASPPTALTYTVTGKYNKAFYPNAVNYAYRDDNAFVFNYDSFALSLWFRSTSSSNPGANEYILGRGGNTTAGYALYFNTAGNLLFGVDDDTTWGPDTSASSPTDLYDGLWHNAVAVKKDNTQIDLYVDGLLVDSKTTIAASGTVNGDNTLVVGGRGEDYSAKFNGSVDEVSIYNYDFGSDQSKLLLNQGKTSQWGYVGTDSSGNPSNSYDRELCVPGDTATCSAPKGHWRFDEGAWVNDDSTLSVKDSSGNEYHLRSGPAGSGPTGAEIGKFGYAGYFDGVNDYLQDPTNADLSINTEDFTLSGWLYKATPASTDVIVAKKATTTATDPGYYLYVSSTGFLRFYISDGTDQLLLSDPTAMPLNQWAHVGVVVDRDSSANTDIYVNGIKRGSSLTCSPCSPTGTIADIGNINPVTAADFTVGAQPAGNTNYEGRIDNLILYTYARTPQQINWEYNRGEAIYNYKFNECSGNTANNSGLNSNGTAVGVNLTIYPQASGNTTVGTCAGSANEMWYGGTNGKFNGSLDFDGTDDYLASSNTVLFTSATSQPYNNFSFGAWVNPATNPTSDTIIHKNNEFRLTTNSSNIPQCEIYYGSWQTAAVATTALPTSTWSHVFCTYDGSNIKIYVNGELKGTQAETDSVYSTSATALNIGRDSASSGYFDGKIDEVTIHSTALNATLVKLLYNENAALRFGQ